MKKTRTRRIFAFVMCLFLLAGPVSGLSIITAFAADIEALPVDNSKKLKITLTWANGADVNKPQNATKVDGKTMVTGKVSVSGSIAGKAKIKVSTVDLSARAVSSWKGLEYRAQSWEFNLGKGESATFHVEVYNMKRYNSSGVMIDSYAPAVKANNFLWTHQVGIQIVEHSDNAYISGTRTLRAYVNIPSGDSYVLNTKANTSVSFYPSSGDSFYQAMRSKGYSYTGAADVHNVPISGVTWDDGKTHKKDNGNYDLGDHGEGHDTAYFNFGSPKTHMENNTANTARLMQFFSGYKVYVAGKFTVGYYNLHNDKFEYWVKVGGSKVSDGTRTGYHDDEKTFTWPSSGDSGTISISRGSGNYSLWTEVSESKQVEVAGKNHDGAYTKYMKNVYMSTLLLDESKPQVADIYLSQAKPYGGASEDLFLMVRMTEPIQLYNSSDKFTVRTTLKNGSNLTDQIIVFKYVDGNNTDTLIFKADISEDQARKLAGDKLVISQIQADGNVQAADFFLNSMGANNQADFLNMSGNRKVAGFEVPFQVDARVPVIEWDGSTTLPTEPVRAFAGNVKITNMASGGTYRYAWSKNRDINAVTEWSKEMTPTHTSSTSTTSKGTVTASGLDGDYYLHVVATSVSGVVGRKTFTLRDNSDNDVKIRFDNKIPKIDYVAGTGQEHNRYKDAHEVTLKITDPQTDAPWTLTEITRVWVFATDESGKRLTSSDVQIYGDGHTAMRFDESTNIFTVNITAEMVGVPDDTYKACALWFKVEDKAGNKTPSDGAATYLPHAVMLDRRDKFDITTQMGYSAAYDDRPELQVSGDYGIEGYDVYYNSYKPSDDTSDSLYMKLTGAVTGSESDLYSLYTVQRDGEMIYDSFTGGWKIGGGGTTGETAASHPAHFTASYGNASKRLSAEIQFHPESAGRYDFVFLMNGSLQSQVVTVYVTPHEAEPTNYTALFDEERLLSNTVWQFSTGQYFSGRAAAGVSYDGTIDAVKPIFSSYEKALEYARYMEAQDVELLYLDPSSSDAAAIVEFLKHGRNPAYMRAGGEETEPALGQTWIRYKSRLWTPSEGANAAYWVYYFYADTQKTRIEANDCMDLSHINANLDDAIQNNAEEIAGKGGSYLYLTKNTKGNYTDTFGQPYYPPSGIFGDSRTFLSTDEKSLYMFDLRYSGDSAIYRGFVNTTVDTVPMRLPLVGNYLFDVGLYGAVYARPYTKDGTAEWWLLTDGQNLRDLGDSGIYELKELGGGYRTYYIYADFDAPLLHYTYIAPGAEQESTSRNQYFSQSFSGQIFQAKAMTLQYFFDAEHPLEGAPSEPDELSYLYLTKSSMGGIIEEVVAFYTKQQLLDAGPLQLADGQYNLYVYDRLGNHYVNRIHVNQSPLIEKEPVVVENTSVTFYFNRAHDEIIEFSITRQGASSSETDTTYAATKTYVKSGTYNLVIKDIFGNVETRSVVLDRVPPAVKFYYANGAGKYEELRVLDADTETPYSVATLRQSGENVYTISSSVDIRVSYDVYAKYKFSFTPENTAHSVVSTMTTSSVNIPVSPVPWTMTICYTNDEDAKITVTCINDAAPPEVAAEAAIAEYAYFDAQGYGNVLFSELGTTRQVSLISGQRVSTDKAVLRWNDGPDGSGVVQVAYTVDDGKTQYADPATGEITLTDAGAYHFTVTDLLGNRTEYRLILADTPSITFALDDQTLIPLPEAPRRYIEGNGADAVFTETAYAGQGMSIRLGEELRLNLLRRVGNSERLYEISYMANTLTVSVYMEGKGYETRHSISLEGVDPSGEITDLEFPLSYSRDSGGLLLKLPFADLEKELWQFRIADHLDSAPYILQVERSNVKPSMTVRKIESLDTVSANGSSFTGINEGFTFEGDPSDLVSVIAYRSRRYTTTFDDISAENTFEMLRAGLVGSVDEEGYYKVVIKNKYGNTQTFLLRVSFGSNMDVILTYEDFEEREHILSKSGDFLYRTNGSALVRIWNLQSTVSVTKDGKRYNPPTRTGNDCIDMTFKDTGVYAVSVIDEFGNRFDLTLDIKAPKTLSYSDFLTGFNEDAAMRAEHYTNAPLSLDRKRLEAGDIAYVAVISDREDQWTVLYDLLSQTQLTYNAENFSESIGRANGTYTVRFADSYGNICETVVHVSDVAQLFVTRNTKNSAANMDYNVTAIGEIGVWSNYMVRLRNTAEAYTLLVDGQRVSFNANGEYILELPLSLGDSASDTHTVEYIDNYGNRYAFTVYLQRQTPAVTTVSDGEEVVRNNTIYVKGSFGFEWEDGTIAAQYVRNGEETLSYTAGDRIGEDGTYVFTFTDRAGNMETRRISRDTAVTFLLMHDGKEVGTGIGLTGHVRIDRDGEEITVLEVLRNGEPYTHEGLTFGEHGSYAVTIADEVGNTATVTFDIFNAPMQSFTYVSKGEYTIYQVWYYIEGVKQPANGILLNAEGYQEFSFYEDGDYEVELLHAPSNTYVTYKVSIDNVAPKVTLLGDIVDGVTRGNVTLEGLSAGDTVEIWRDGVLAETYKIGSGKDSPVIEKAGSYRLVIRDEAGNETVHEFIREFTTNTAANVICLVFLGGAVGCALYLHKRGRIRIK